MIGIMSTLMLICFILMLSSLVDGLLAIIIGHLNIEVVILMVLYHQGCSIHVNEGKIN